MLAKKLCMMSALVAATTLTAAACGSGGGTPSSGGGVGATGGGKTGASTGGGGRGSSSGSVTLTMWNGLNSQQPGTPAAKIPASKWWFNVALKMFEKQNPNIKVKIVQSPNLASSAFETLLKSSEVAGNTPDIGQLYAGGQITQNGKYLVPLNSALPKSFINSLLPSGWQFSTGGFKKGGPIYGVPFGAGYYYYVFYNKALFKKAGVQPLPETANWNDLVALAKKIKAKGITPFVFGEKEGYFGAWTQDALISGEVGTQGVLDMYTGKMSLDTPTIIKPYAAWHELFADGLTNSNAVSLTNTSGSSEFQDGKAAMTITGDFSDTGFEQSLGKNVGLFPVPALPGSRYTKFLSGGPNDDYVIFKNTKHAAQAEKLIQFLASLKVQKMALNQDGALPNNVAYKAGPSLYKSNPLLAAESKYIQVQHYQLFEAFDNVMPGSIDSYWYQTNNGVFGGSLSPASAASSLNTQMQQFLQTQNAG